MDRKDGDAKKVAGLEDERKEGRRDEMNVN